MSWSSKFSIDFIYASESDNWCLLEEFYCYASIALPCAQFDSEGLSFRDIWMASTPTETEPLHYNDETAILPLAMQAACAELLYQKEDPSEWVDEIVEYMRDGTIHPDHPKPRFIADIGTAASRRLGMALAYIS